MTLRAVAAAAVMGLAWFACGGGGGSRTEEVAPQPAPGGNAVLVTNATEGTTDPKAIWVVTAVSQRPVMRGGLRISVPDSLRQRGIHGDVVLEYVIDTLGHVEPAMRVVSSAYPELIAPAKAALSRALFRPGRVQGRPVRVLLATRIRIGSGPAGGTP